MKSLLKAIKELSLRKFRIRPIDKLLSRLDSEISLGYYDVCTLRKVRKWAREAANYDF